MSGDLIRGVVTQFDQTRGLGAIETESGVFYSFHATSITDGTRTITIGQSVVAKRRATHGGQVEAIEIADLST